MDKPYRWGDVAPDAASRIKERRASRARMCRLRQAACEQGLAALSFVDEGASAPEHLQAVLHELREISNQLKPDTESFSFPTADSSRSGHAANLEALRGECSTKANEVFLVERTNKPIRNAGSRLTKLHRHIALFSVACGAKVCGVIGSTCRSIFENIRPGSFGGLGKFVGTAAFNLAFKFMLFQLRLEQLRSKLLGLQLERVDGQDIGGGNAQGIE